MLQEAIDKNSKLKYLVEYQRKSLAKFEEENQLLKSQIKCEKNYT
jgi:hypothetical protein